MLNILVWTLILTVSLFYWHTTNLYYYWKKRGVVYDKPIFLLGSLGFFMRKSFWDFFYELKIKYPKDYLGIYFGWKPILVVQSPELARKILVEDANYFQHRYGCSGSDGDPVGSVSLFFAKEPERKQLQQAMTAMFTPSRLKAIAEFMNVNAIDLTKKIQRDYIDKKKNVNLKEIFTMYATDTVAFSVFGLEANALHGEPSSILLASKQMVKWNFLRGLEMLLILFFPDLAKLLRMKFFSATATDVLRKIFRKSVKDREITDKNAIDFVGHMLNMKERFSFNRTPDQIENLMLSQAATFILASSIAPSATLSYCCHELAYHPNEQQKLYEEINASGQDVLVYKEMQQLKYLTAVLNETLRKHVPAQHLDRITIKDYKLTDELTIEKGVPVFINLAALHFDENIFPKPTAWNPERFLESNKFNHYKFSFLPFGAGPRSCAGKRYGMMQLRIAMFHILRNFKIEPAMPYTIKSDPKSIVRAPYNGGEVKFAPRDYTT